MRGTSTQHRHQLKADVNVAFINENTLGHASYLVPFVQALHAHPELGVEPHLIDATPLPKSLALRANFSVRGLRKWGLDFHNARWRLTVSRHVHEQLMALRARKSIDAVVVNTQSVALGLADVARELPVLVWHDATFAQLARTRWFAPNAPSRLFLPLTSAPVRSRERQLFRAAHHFLPWSETVRQSLLKDYQIPVEKISLLPPSLAPPPRRRKIKPEKTRPQILFVGGDFARKGGPLLLECFRNHFSDHCELHLVTQSGIPPEPGVLVHRGLTAQSEAWRERWRRADVFVFPSTLETFGIVLVEALAYEVPVIAAEVGAAREILANGAAGWLLPDTRPTSLTAAINEVLRNPLTAQTRVQAGRLSVEKFHNLDTNAAALAGWLRKAASF